MFDIWGKKCRVILSFQRQFQIYNALLRLNLIHFQTLHDIEYNGATTFMMSCLDPMSLQFHEKFEMLYLPKIENL